MSTEVKNEKDIPQGIILYCDGGCRGGTNPGYAGYGMHGYLFMHEVPTKGSGNPDHIITDRGYVTKSDYEKHKDSHGRTLKEVTPIHFVDGYGSFNTLMSNNVAEVQAAIHGLQYAAQHVVKTVQIYTDSEYVCKGFDTWMDSWKKNNWLKSDGTPPANVGFWKALAHARDVLIERGVQVNINWIKGHNDHLGNELADKLATVGVMASKMGILRNETNIRAANGYWKYSVNRNPLIANRRMYFNTLSDYFKPGEYYLGEHGKDDDMLGTRISDGAYSLVRLKVPDPLLEMIRNHQAMMAGNTDTIMMLRLDHLYRSDTHQQLSLFGTEAIEQTNPTRLDLYCLDREPLTRELRPPRLAMRAVEAIEDMSRRLEQYLANDPSIIVTDLTPILYEVCTKSNKKGIATETMKLKNEYNVGFAALPVVARYGYSEDIKTASITLTLGIDLADRNALKRLEDYMPTVTLLTWMEAPNVFRYATVIKTQDDIGMFCGYYSNMHYIPTDTDVNNLPD